MSRPTEARIHALCWDAIAATEERDVERIIAELREALQEHIKHAQINLSRQAALFRKDAFPDRDALPGRVARPGR